MNKYGLFSSGSRPVALVTGASSGIGAQYARRLARLGCNLIIVSNQADQIRETAAGIAACFGHADLTGRSDSAQPEPEAAAPFSPPCGPWVYGLCRDLADPAAARSLWQFCTDRGIAVEMLINNAGIFIFRDTADCTPERTELIVRLHVETVTLLCRYFGEDMRKRGKGYILNMSSVSAHTPFPGISLYTATKSYIRTFSRAFHYEMKEYGVNVLTVSPGAVATDLYNLPPRLQKLGVRLGIIYRPERLARKAIDKLLRGKTEFVPGCLNRLFKPVFAVLPGWFKMAVRRKLKPLMK